MRPGQLKRIAKLRLTPRQAARLDAHAVEMVQAGNDVELWKKVRDACIEAEANARGAESWMRRRHKAEML